MGRFDRVYAWFDDRLGLSKAQTFLGKAFPAEDSYLLGEVAAFCFLLLVLTGIFLGFFFEPSTTEVTYEGSVAEYQGEEMPEAFVSVLNITYDVPFGMFIRRLHHWAAHLFIASIGLHMLRVFFTGAYRNPREINWLVGTALASLAMAAAYTGYALPFDEFASTAASIGYNIATSIPLLGDPIGQIVFGGDFPSTATVPRLFFLHVLVIPLLIAGLLGLHFVILIRQKHTEAPRDEDVTGREHVDRDDDSVVIGLPMVPNQAAVSAAVFFLTLAVLSLLAGFLPVHNIAEYGPTDPASTPSLVMPDWFLMWGYGFLKLTPAWMSFDLFGVHVSSEFVGGLLLPGLVFVSVAVWPFIDYESEPTHFGADPLERPVPTAVGIAGVVFVMLASIAGMDVIVADLVGSTTAVIRPYLTAILIIGPILAGLTTYAVLGGFGNDEQAGGRATDNDGGDRSDARSDAIDTPDETSPVADKDGKQPEDPDE
ncbi:cytochrome b [Saliphagus infecundisoli]|uniref:Cytochrome bc complex cytochrome b subunit n=1 Tax=Saliphagus infecundisoli TaxID=1849069 RepID=A0ABD5QN49_9EURY|nr:cytochrome bc complex cytochrome b subunit [Saliphagus infecundisoli]